MDDLKKDIPVRIYIDRWCASNVRKVWSCEQCLHYLACKEAGHSLSPRAIEHRENRDR